MARLFRGEKVCKREDLIAVLERFEQELTESEVADLLHWGRRTVNNYLRELAAEHQVYKEGRLWFAAEGG